jgi:hypothetical protein
LLVSDPSRFLGRQETIHKAAEAVGLFVVSNREGGLFLSIKEDLTEEEIAECASGYGHLA